MNKEEVFRGIEYLQDVSTAVDEWYAEWHDFIGSGKDKMMLEKGVSVINCLKFKIMILYSKHHCQKPNKPETQEPV